MKGIEVGNRLRRGAIMLIRVYQHSFSLLFGPCCRFSPSCSSYASESIDRFGITKGIRISLKRLLRCHPLSPGGYDPVPENNKNN